MAQASPSLTLRSSSGSSSNNSNSSTSTPDFVAFADEFQATRTRKAQASVAALVNRPPPRATEAIPTTDLSERDSNFKKQMVQACEQLQSEKRALEVVGLPDDLEQQLYSTSLAHLQPSAKAPSDAADHAPPPPVAATSGGDEAPTSTTSTSTSSTSEAQQLLLEQQQQVGTLAHTLGFDIDCSRMVTTHTAVHRLSNARALIVASIPETKAVTPYQSSSKPYAVYNIVVTLASVAVINTWKRYSQLQEIHEHFLEDPSRPDSYPSFPPKSWPASLFTDRLDAQSLSDRRIQLELWLQRIINLPLVLQSSFFHSSLDLSETQSKQLYDVGRWLRSLERQVMLASRFDSVLNMHRLRVRMTTDFEHAQTFIAKGLSHLLYERPIVFGLPLPSRGSVVYGPDGLPWFTRRHVTSFVGQIASTILELYNMNQELIATTEGNGNAELCTFKGWLQKGGERELMFTLTRQQETSIIGHTHKFLLILEREQSSVEVERILEVWHTKSFGLRRFTESEPFALMSREHAIVEQTRGVQIRDNTDVISVLCVCMALEHLNSDPIRPGGSS